MKETIEAIDDMKNKTIQVYIAPIVKVTKANISNLVNNTNIMHIRFIGINSIIK